MTHREYEFNGPILNLTLELTRREAMVAFPVWVVLNAALAVVMLYGYAVLLPPQIGFETTVLVGLGIVALSGGASS